MIREINQSISVNYCKRCGWSITDDFFEELIGIKEQDSYCKHCGTKLITEKFQLKSET